MQEGLIPKAKRGYPGGSLTSEAGGTGGTKRMQMFNGTKVPGVGFKQTLDAMAFNGADEANTPGMMSNSSTDLMDTEVIVKIAMVDTDFPENNDFTDKLPLGCCVFIRAPKDRTEREKACLNQNGIKSFSDQLHCVTPEQLRYQLHLNSIDNKTRGTCEPISLVDIREDWKFFGLCDQKPIKAGYADARFAATMNGKELRWIRTVHRSTQAKMNNYWRMFKIDGQTRPFLWFKLQEVDIGKETMYVLGTEKDGRPTFHLGNTWTDPAAARAWAIQRYRETPAEDKVDLTEEQAIEQVLTIRYVPAIVPLATQSKGLTRNDLAYEVTLPSGQKQRREGFAIFVGRCTKRPNDPGEEQGDSAPTEASLKRMSKDACTDMCASQGALKIDLIIHTTGKIFG